MPGSYCHHTILPRRDLGAEKGKRSRHGRILVLERELAIVRVGGDDGRRHLRRGRSWFKDQQLV